VINKREPSSYSKIRKKTQEILFKTKKRRPSNTKEPLLTSEGSRRKKGSFKNRKRVNFENMNPNLLEEWLI
jgi:hypothetical protein